MSAGPSPDPSEDGGTEHYVLQPLYLPLPLRCRLADLARDRRMSLNDYLRRELAQAALSACQVGDGGRMP